MPEIDANSVLWVIAIVVALLIFVGMPIAIWLEANPPKKQPKGYCLTCEHRLSGTCRHFGKD
jgi:hypothetical protein